MNDNTLTQLYQFLQIIVSFFAIVTIITKFFKN